MTDEDNPIPRTLEYFEQLALEASVSGAWGRTGGLDRLSTIAGLMKHEWDQERLRDVLLKVFHETKRPEVRDAALDALAWLGGIQLLPIFLGAFESDPARAVRYFSTLDEPPVEACDRLAQAFRIETLDHCDRLMALRTIARHDRQLAGRLADEWKRDFRAAGEPEEQYDLSYDIRFDVRDGHYPIDASIWFKSVKTGGSIVQGVKFVISDAQANDIAADLAHARGILGGFYERLRYDDYDLQMQDIAGSRFAGVWMRDPDFPILTLIDWKEKVVHIFDDLIDWQFSSILLSPDGSELSICATYGIETVIELDWSRSELTF